MGANGTSSPVRFIDPDINLHNTLEDGGGANFNIDTIQGSIKIGSSPVNVKIAATDLNCSKDNTGKINIISTGTGAPYTYTWESKANSLVKGGGTMALGDTVKLSI